MKKELITAPNYKGGLGDRSWSPGIKVGPWLFLSGITAVDYATKQTVGRAPSPAAFTPGTADPEAQWRQTLTNVSSMLAAAGGTMSDVVVANVFVTDMAVYYDFEWVRKEFFEEPYPACTALEVGSLVSPEWVIEIEVQAYISEPSSG